MSIMSQLQSQPDRLKRTSVLDAFSSVFSVIEYWDQLSLFVRTSKISKPKSCYPIILRYGLTIWLQARKWRGIMFGLGHDLLAENPVQMFRSPVCPYCGMQLLTHTRSRSHIPRLWFPIWYKADNLGNVWDVAGCRCGQVQRRRMWEVGFYVCFANADLMKLSRWLPECKPTSGLLICRLTSSDWD